MTALQCILRGYGYDITGVDVLDAYAAVKKAATTMGLDVTSVKANVDALISSHPTGGDFVQRVLARHLAT